MKENEELIAETEGEKPDGESGDGLECEES
jgi:hypothetical protein